MIASRIYKLIVAHLYITVTIAPVDVVLSSNHKFIAITYFASNITFIFTIVKVQL